MDRCRSFFFGIVSLALVLTVAFGAAGGGGKSGRSVAADEPERVGSRRSGAAVWRANMAKAMEQLLAQYGNEERAQGKRRVAFVGVENKTRDEIRDIRDALNQAAITEISESKAFTLISQRFVEAALREIGRPPADLFLAQPREDFKSVLGKQGMTPDFLLFANLTSMTTSAEDIKQVYYQMSLEMVDANTGEVDASKTAEIRKEYEG